MATFAARGCWALLFTTAVASQGLLAAEPLRWKFEPGLTNRYRLTQQTDVDRTGAGGAAQASTTLVIDTSWTVKRVEDDGSARLEQRIDRMHLKSTTGDGQQAEIDSQSVDSPQGPAAMLVPLLKAVTSAPFMVTMTPRGEIADVEVPENLAEALKNQPGAAQMGELANAEGFERLVGQAAFVLPEQLEPGAEWTATTETSTPAAGRQTTDVTYRYQGSRAVDGQTMEVFIPSIRVKFAGGAAAIEVADQQSEGELLFNRDEGRLQSSTLKQSMKLRITVDGQLTEQQIDQQIDMQWLPPG